MSSSAPHSRLLPVTQVRSLNLTKCLSTETDCVDWIAFAPTSPAQFSQRTHQKAALNIANNLAKWCAPKILLEDGVKTHFIHRRLSLLTSQTPRPPLRKSCTRRSVSSRRPTHTSWISSAQVCGIVIMDKHTLAEFAFENDQDASKSRPSSHMRKLLSHAAHASLFYANRLVVRRV